jgi:acetyl esterase
MRDAEPSYGVDIAEVLEINRAGVPVRLYRPEGAEGTAVYLHGGGWVMGTLDTYDAFCRTLAARSGATIAALDYSLAPAAHHPTQINEVWRLLRWLRKAGMPTSIAGDGVGAYLAVQAAVLAVAGDLPLVGLGLIYPLTGPGPRVSPDDPEPPAESPGAHWEHYLPAAPAPDGPPLSLDDLDLRGLPGTAVLSAAEHPRREQAEGLTARLRAAGVDVTAVEHAGPPHDFLRPTRPGPEADAALEELADFLSRLGDPYSFGGVPLS